MPSYFSSNFKLNPFASHLAAKVDGRLEEAKSTLVPRKLREDEFWLSYFFQMTQLDYAEFEAAAVSEPSAVASPAASSAAAAAAAAVCVSSPTRMAPLDTSDASASDAPLLAAASPSEVVVVAAPHVLVEAVAPVAAPAAQVESEVPAEVVVQYATVSAVRDADPDAGGAAAVVDTNVAEDASQSSEAL